MKNKSLSSAAGLVIRSVFTVSRCGQLTFHELILLLSSLSRPPTGSATAKRVNHLFTRSVFKAPLPLPNSARAQWCKCSRPSRKHHTGPELCRVTPNRDHNNYTFNYFWANAHLYSPGAWVCTVLASRADSGWGEVPSLSAALLWALLGVSHE